MAKLAAFALAAWLALSGREACASGPDPWVSRDKALHFDVSAGLAAAGYAVSAGWLVDARWKALALGGGVALGAGAGKELLDLAGVGQPSWKDFAWDAFGTVAGLVLAWGVDMIVGGVGESRPALEAPRGRAASAGILLHF